MQPEGGSGVPSNPSDQVPATDDEIREKYLERAIRELNQLTREIQGCEHCPRGNLMPVLGSGHPQADIFMLKFAPKPAEIEEGVAFYGRAGSALMKSFKRLGIDPLAVYGTVVVKCPVPDTDMAAEECKARVLDEFAVVQPRIVVAMGEEALEELNALGVPLAAEVAADPRPGAEAHPELRRPLRARHRRVARRRARQAGFLGRLPRARRVVRRLPALLGLSFDGGRRSKEVSMQENAHVLVVANRTAESEELLAALKERAAEGPVKFTLLVPATPHGVAWAADMHSGGDEAKAHMDDAAVARLQNEAGLEVTGMLGDPDPNAAVQDAVNLGDGVRRGDRLDAADRLSKWLKLDLPHKVERVTGLPVTHVVGQEVKAEVSVPRRRSSARKPRDLVAQLRELALDALEPVRTRAARADRPGTARGAATASAGASSSSPPSSCW